MRVIVASSHIAVSGSPQNRTNLAIVVVMMMVVVVMMMVADRDHDLGIRGLRERCGKNEGEQGVQEDFHIWVDGWLGRGVGDQRTIFPPESFPSSRTLHLTPHSKGIEFRRLVKKATRRGHPRERK
jgi:hypothetical protein